jgi:hypothetical protein
MTKLIIIIKYEFPFKFLYIFRVFMQYVVGFMLNLYMIF